MSDTHSTADAPRSNIQWSIRGLIVLTAFLATYLASIVLLRAGVGGLVCSMVASTATIYYGTKWGASKLFAAAMGILASALHFGVFAGANRLVDIMTDPTATWSNVPIIRDVLGATLVGFVAGLIVASVYAAAASIRDRREKSTKP